MLNVTLDDGTVLPAKLLGADPIYDLAILNIPEPNTGKLPTLTFADSDKIRPCDVPGSSQSISVYENKGGGGKKVH